jgi:hypothetical protein
VMHVMTRLLLELGTMRRVKQALGNDMIGFVGLFASSLLSTNH